MFYACFKVLVFFCGGGGGSYKHNLRKEQIFLEEKKLPQKILKGLNLSWGMSTRKRGTPKRGVLRLFPRVQQHLPRQHLKHAWSDTRKVGAQQHLAGRTSGTCKRGGKRKGGYLHLLAKFSCNPLQAKKWHLESRLFLCTWWVGHDIPSDTKLLLKKKCLK